MRYNLHQLPQQDTSHCTKGKGHKTEHNNLQRIHVQKRLCRCGRADTGSEENDNDVHHCVRRGFRQLADNSALAEQVAEHQHADQRSRRRKKHADNNRDNNREKNLFQLGDRTELFHLDLSVLFRRKRLHDRRLDDRNQGHIGISRDRNRAHERGLSKLSCQEDRGRSVGTADDGDRSSGFAVEAKRDRQEISNIDTRLSRGAHHKRDRVRDQRSEVGHRSDTHEDQGRKNRCLIQNIEIMHQAAGMFDAENVYRNIRNNIRIDIDKQHAESNRDQQKRFEVVFDRQIQEHKRDKHHDIVAPCQIQERSLMQKI